MTGAVPSSVREPLVRTWPAIPRTLAGALIGWAIGAWIVENPGPDWRTPAAVVAMAAIALGAPLTALASTLGGPPAWALASAIGLYVGVPETNHVLGLGAGLGVLVIAELTGRARADGPTVVALGGVLVWALLQGGGTREPAVLAGFGTLGLLVLWPLLRHLPGPRKGVAPRGVRPLLVTTTHAAVVWIVGRRGAVVDDRVDMALIAVAGGIVLLIVTRLLVGSRPA